MNQSFIHNNFIDDKCFQQCRTQLNDIIDLVARKLVRFEIINQMRSFRPKSLNENKERVPLEILI